MITIDRSAWARLAVSGEDRVRFLQGLTTVNVATLAAAGPGAHAWGAILNPKGRVLAVIDVTTAADHFVIACEASLGAPTRAILERYAVMDDVAFTAVEGPAHQRVTDAASLWLAPIVTGVANLGAPGEGPVLAEDDPEVERLRLRAGLPRYGIDVDDSNFPFETPLGALIDYGKGCYVGQEPVFRVHAQGNASRALRGLRVEGAAPLARGAVVRHPTRDVAGTVTSAIVDGDATLALAYLHRTTWEVGGKVEIEGRAAEVHELPW
jgi:folate-binding protein YgfZ